MTEPRTGPQTRPPAAETGPRQAEPVPWGELARELTDALATALRERGRLAMLEAQQAVIAAAQAVAMAAAVALVAVTAWFGLWAAVVVAAAEAGAPWWLALLVAVIVNAGAAAVLVWLIRKRLAMMSFAATLRNAGRPKSSPDRAAAGGEQPSLQASP